MKLKEMLLTTLIVICTFAFNLTPAFADITIFDDDFQDTPVGAATQASLNSNINVGTWTVGNQQESAIITNSGVRALMLDQGAYSYTAQFSQPGSLSAGTNISFETNLRRRNNAAKINEVIGFDANSNELFHLRYTAPANNDTNNAVQYFDGVSYQDVAKPSLKWSSGFNPNNLSELEIVLSATGYDVFVDIDNDGIPDDSVLNINYLNAPTAGIDQLQLIGNSQAGARYNDLLVVAGENVVPEPASIAIWSLLGLCLAGYGYQRRRRNS